MKQGANPQNQYDNLVRSLFSDGCTKEQFVHRVSLRGIKTETAKLMVSAFDESNG
jgi:hypothetical protein